MEGRRNIQQDQHGRWVMNVLPYLAAVTEVAMDAGSVLFFPRCYCSRPRTWLCK